MLLKFSLHDQEAVPAVNAKSGIPIPTLAPMHFSSLFSFLYNVFSKIHLQFT